MEVSFRDPNADVVELQIKELQGPNAGEEFSFNPDVEGEEEGTFTFIIRCENNRGETFTVRAELTLIDAEGLESNTESFSYDCTPPEE